jgi:L-lactate dehydrogenase
MSFKVSIIGGGGRVGSDAAYALQIGGVVSEIVLVDANADLAAGEALDLMHGSALSSSQTIRSGGYELVGDSDCVVITAGLRRKPDESRLELMNRNLGLFNEILREVKNSGLKGDATILVVSNPVDVLTRVAAESGVLPQNQVLGLGTVLDTCRFRSLLAQRYGVGATDVDALILGEHGDSMVPMWSSATVNGMPLRSVPGFDQAEADGIFDFTKRSGAEVIRLKGGAGRAVGISIQTVVEAMALDQGAILPVSSVQGGTLGIQGVALSLPTQVGRAGVRRVFEPQATEEEIAALRKSAQALETVWSQVSTTA